MLSCIKVIVVLYNFIFWLLGVLILGLTAYFWWDSQNYLDVNEVGKSYVTPLVVFLVIGAIMTIVGFLGCCGAIRESKCLLGLYFLFCLTMCIASGAALFWIIQNEDTVRNEIKTHTTKLIKLHYGTGKTNATELLVDRIQRDFTCCGVEGPKDWISSNFNNINSNSSAFERGISTYLPEQATYRIPHSCCEPNSPICYNRVDRIQNTERLKDIDGIHTEGCMNKFEQFIRDKWYLILLMGCAIVGVQVFALLFACFLCCAISRTEDN